MYYFKSPVDLSKSYQKCIKIKAKWYNQQIKWNIKLNFLYQNSFMYSTIKVLKIPCLSISYVKIPLYLEIVFLCSLYQCHAFVWSLAL